VGVSKAVRFSAEPRVGLLRPSHHFTPGASGRFSAKTTTSPPAISWRPYRKNGVACCADGLTPEPVHLILVPVRQEALARALPRDASPGRLRDQRAPAGDRPSLSVALWLGRPWVAILAREPEAAHFAQKIAEASRPISAGHALLEESMRLCVWPRSCPSSLRACFKRPPPSS